VKAEEAQYLLIHMQRQLPDTDHLLEDYRAKAAYTRYLEETDYEAAVEALKTFKAQGRFPSITDMEAHIHPDHVWENESENDYFPQPISTKAAAQAHLRAAREALNKGE